MRTSVRDVTQASPGMMPRHQGERPPATGPAAAGNTAVAATPTRGLPEDIVTLSSSPGPEKKASQPVSGEEKKALLRPDSPKAGFSTYG